MEGLGAALKAISTSLEASRTLDETLGDIEGALSRCFGATAVEISPAARSGGEKPGALVVPLRLDGATVGTMTVSWPGQPEAAAIDAVRLLATTIAAAIACRTHREDSDLLRKRARTDALTKIPNRLAFDERIGVAWRRCRERRVPLSIALIDIDFFKSYNDEYGHVAGDWCLQRVAALIARRRADGEGFAARYGGEEFVVISEDVELMDAVAHAQRIADLVAEQRIEHAGTTLGRVSLSVGIASLVPTSESGSLELVGEADRALYRAKRLGRNRICAGTSVSRGPIVARRSPLRAALHSSHGGIFGRDADLARTLAALRHGRLVTLVGPPGIGKSRLLRLVADAAGAQFDGTVFCVELGWLDADANLGTAIAAELNLAIDSSDALETLADFLNERETLMLMDTGALAAERIRHLCEYLMRQAPGLSIVVAGRARLGLVEERSIVVPPLDDNAALELLKVRLDDESIDATEPELLAKILRRLGGNPGAIEAAAQHLARIGPRAMLDSLETAPAAG